MSATSETPVSCKRRLQRERDWNSSLSSPRFAICCVGGKVRLPPVLDFPPYLLDLYTFFHLKAISFHKNIRAYNKILACSFFGANLMKAFKVKQYVVNQYSKIENYYLNYLKFNQSSLHSDLYKGVTDIHAGNKDADNRDAGDIR
ncbi:hypothetical protein C1646_772604 [Rhizophagus diaphanus]|nr:hypothetical protein C1646_772604 [Rhizophagus diaphanus] [Rhizophagus sp. MUCL 43196]